LIIESEVMEAKGERRVGEGPRRNKDSRREQRGERGREKPG